MIQIFLDLVIIEQILNVDSELCSHLWPFGNLLEIQFVNCEANAVQPNL